MADTDDRVAELPKATLRGGPFRVRPKHLVALFALVSLIGAAPHLAGWTIYFPPFGLPMDAAWLAPLVIPLVRKRVGTGAAVWCLVAFAAQAFVIELPDALENIGNLRLMEVLMLVGITGGLVASIVAIVKPDPDPDFMPNEFTIR